MQAVFEKILNLISLGKWEEQKSKLNYDNMFHLFIVVKLDNGVYIRMEKNEVIRIRETSYSVVQNEYTKTLQILPENDTLIFGPILYMGTQHTNKPQFTLGQLIHASMVNFQTVTGLPYSDYFLYNGKNNNCQWFIKTMLKPYNDYMKMNGIYDNFVGFAMQDLEGVYAGLQNYVKKFMKGVTDMGHAFSYWWYNIYH